MKIGESWNPHYGCKKTSKGCMRCYVFREMRMYGLDPTTVQKSKTRFEQPLRWKDRRLIFTPSWSDWFLPEADQWRDEEWDVIRRASWHTFRILTKRPERIENHLPADWEKNFRHVWLGVTVEAQEYVWRMDILRGISTTLRWVSAEPLLSRLTLDLRKFGWLIDGGESDRRNPRPADPDWFRSLRDQCAKARIPYFHKQNGGKSPCPCHKTWGCVFLDGRIHNDLPKW